MTQNWLILETSGRVARVGLARAGALVGRAELDSSRRHAREMMPTVVSLLSAEGLGPRDLTGVMAGTGPGSYTGLRVGLVTAKALAYSLGCELRAVGTFWAVAHQAPAAADGSGRIVGPKARICSLRRNGRRPAGSRATSIA